MEVILLEDVEKLGASGDKVRVARGFAVNYLFPRGKAAAASAKNLQRNAQDQQRREKKSKQIAGEAATLAAELEKLSITLPRQAGEDDKLFGSVTSIDVEKELAAKGYSIQRKQIQMDKPIKALGIYTVPIKLHPDVAAQVKIWVIHESS